MITSRRRVMVIVVSAVLALGLLFALNRSPERVREFGLSYSGLGIVHGEMFSRGPSPTVVRAEAVEGGKVREIRLPLSKGAALRELIRLPGGRTLIHTDEAGPEMLRRGIWPSNSPTNYAGQRAKLWDISAGMTDAREVLPNLEMSALCVAGRHCFWLKPSGQRTVYNKIGNRTLPRVLDYVDLYATPLDGGPSMRVGSRLALYTQLDAVGNGVCWRGAPDYGGSLDTRYLALPPDFRVRELKQMSAAPTLLRDRLYWNEAPILSAPGSPKRNELTTSDLNGEDRRILLDLANHAEWLPFGQILAVQNGPLYCVLRKRLQGPGGSYAGLASHLCRLDQAGVKPLCRLPADASAYTIDEGYLYFAVPQKKENWFDWSATGLMLKRTSSVLYRLPLPPD